LGDESLEEISARSGTSADTIRSRVRLARRSLKLRIANDPALRELLGR
jgi:DNA-directed RNA polymerase specialized sigma24 family protein